MPDQAAAVEQEVWGPLDEAAQAEAPPARHEPVGVAAMSAVDRRALAGDDIFVSAGRRARRDAARHGRHRVRR